MPDIREISLPIGTQVLLKKVAADTFAPIPFSTMLTGGFVYAAVGTKAYIYNPTCELLEENGLRYTAATARIIRIASQSGKQYLFTSSGSVYEMTVLPGEPLLHPEQTQPVVPLERSTSNDVSQPPISRAELLGQGAAAAEGGNNQTGGIAVALRAGIDWLLRKKRP